MNKINPIIPFYIVDASIRNASMAKYSNTSKIEPLYFINEIWVDIEDFPNYMVSQYGRIYNKLLGVMMVSAPNINGYLQTRLIDKNGDRKSLLVHRIVAKAFIPNPNNLPYVNHKDANRVNPYVLNLEWCTKSYNNQYAYDIGNNIRGEDHKFAKHSEETIRAICEGLQNGYSYEYICKNILKLEDDEDIRLMKRVITSIRTGVKWKGISKDYVFQNHKYTTLTNNDVHRICKLLENKLPIDDIVYTIYPNISDSDFNDKYQSILCIRQHKIYKNISKNYNF